MDEVKRVSKLKLEHKVLMGAKNSLNDEYLLVYLPTKKEFVTYFYNRDFDSVSMGHYLNSAAAALEDLLKRARKKEGSVDLFAVEENIHLLKDGKTKF